jgi:hypothetical protein
MNVSAAAIKRAVPETRLRVASSVKAMVKVKPGTSTIKPASTSTKTELAPKSAANVAAVKVASSAATISKTRAAIWPTLPTKSPSNPLMPISQMPPRKNTETAAEVTPKAKMVTHAG